MTNKIGVPPEEVLSPKAHWGLVAVLDDGSQDGSGAGCALAVGRWDGKPVLALRWNGDQNNTIGNPQSRGIPTWFIIPDKFNEAILTSGGLAADKLAVARNSIPAPGQFSDVMREMDREPFRYTYFFRWKRQHLEILGSLIDAGGRKHYDPNREFNLHSRLHELQNMRMVEMITDATDATFQITDFGRRVHDADWSES